MENNEKILTEWKPIHEKGMRAYVLPHAIKYFFAFGAIVIVFLFLPRSPRTNITSIIATNILIYFFLIYSRVRDWFIKNNKYLDIMESQENKEISSLDQKEYFNRTFEGWKEISDEKGKLICRTINMLEIEEGASVLDIGAGTGVFYEFLKELKPNRYMAVDISENMLGEIKTKYPEAETLCGDFDKEISIPGKFDFVVIFNSIPHFENLEQVFTNGKAALREGGTFAIVHGRTRAGLKEHHEKIGYKIGRDGIPQDGILIDLLKRNGFQEYVIKDEEFFFFSCK